MEPLFQYFYHLPVGWQPLHAVEFVRGEPAGGLVFEEGERTALHGAEEAVHREVKLGVVPLDGVQQFAHGDAGV